MSNIKMLNKKEEPDREVEVSWVDQQKINEFSKYSANIEDLEDQYKKLKDEKEYLDEVGSELELADEDESIRYKVGDTFIHITAAEAIERIEKDSDKLTLSLEEVEKKIEVIKGKMAELKKALYAKFGNAINLEKD